MADKSRKAITHNDLCMESEEQWNVHNFIIPIPIPGLIKKIPNPG